MCVLSRRRVCLDRRQYTRRRVAVSFRWATRRLTSAPPITFPPPPPSLAPACAFSILRRDGSAKRCVTAALPGRGANNVVMPAVSRCPRFPPSLSHSHAHGPRFVLQPVALESTPEDVISPDDRDLILRAWLLRPLYTRCPNWVIVRAAALFTLPRSPASTAARRRYEAG